MRSSSARTETRRSDPCVSPRESNGQCRRCFSSLPATTITQRAPREAKRCQVATSVGDPFAASQRRLPPRGSVARLHFAGRRRGRCGCVWLLRARCVCVLFGSSQRPSGHYICGVDAQQTTEKLPSQSTRNHQAAQVRLNPIRTFSLSPSLFRHAVSLPGAWINVMNSGHALRDACRRN